MAYTSDDYRFILDDGSSFFIFLDPEDFETSVPKETEITDIRSLVSYTGLDGVYLDHDTEKLAGYADRLYESARTKETREIEGRDAQKPYRQRGHIGYSIDGRLFIICNDPYVSLSEVCARFPDAVESFLDEKSDREDAVFLDEDRMYNAIEDYALIASDARLDQGF